MPPPPVTVAMAVAQDVPVYLDEIGKSGAFESVTVTPQIAGRITERLFEDGAQLKKDQPLFTIDPRPFQAQLDAAQAQLAQSRRRAGSGQHATEDVREHCRHPRRFAARLRDQEEHRGAGRGAGAGRRSRRRKRQAQSRVLPHPFAD